MFHDTSSFESWIEYTPNDLDSVRGSFVRKGSAFPVTALVTQRNAELKGQVRRTEIAFAKTMANRDHAAFGKFLADEAVSVGAKELHGAQQGKEAWKRFFDGPTAPFSREPDTMALTSGAVRDPAGERTGTFHSTWRRELGGHWRILLDMGCNCGANP